MFQIVSRVRSETINLHLQCRSKLTDICMAMNSIECNNTLVEVVTFQMLKLLLSNESKSE